ncbi:MAG: efflux RND transporter periplasmic adaptor subunit [Bradyrhizobium sp.]|nr:efflux RND transporter periplasmic adaptor subunit [Bradyrhizobium sp.]MDE2241685.1 efflux RND transporter periplasmic adaptor subunit [Bradyrhizobium sp.]MDE2470399.1 efflux RND transporter periplasmic adaptor subunit [Bradyrhizobium sp.]
MTTLRTLIEGPYPTKMLRAALILTTAICAGAAAAEKLAAEAQAKLVALHAATLSSEMAGRIDAIATRVGDRFRKGDVLVTFDCALPNAQLTHAQATLTEAARKYEIERRATAQKTTGQLELDIPAAEVLKAKADLAAAEALVSRCSITAPFAGVTVDQKIRAFEYATPGQALLGVLDDHALEVELTAPSRWLRRLRPGTAFQLAIDETGKTYPGKVVRLGGRVNGVNQSVRVFGEVMVEAPELMPGMSGNAILSPP